MPATSSSEPSRELSSSLVLDLPEIDAHALSLAGGKAANLGELLRAGLPVPPGVCILTDAYRRVAAGAGLTAVLDRLAATPAADTTTLAALAGEARAAMLAAPVPDPVARAVVDGYRRLGPDVPVAVRSSATAEDLPHASFAGQQDTYLNVVGAEAVLRRRPPLLGVAVDGPRRRLSRHQRHRSRARCGSPWSSSGWSTPRSPACSSRPTR